MVSEDADQPGHQEDCGHLSREREEVTRGEGAAESLDEQESASADESDDDAHVAVTQERGTYGTDDDDGEEDTARPALQPDQHTADRVAAITSAKRGRNSVQTRETGWGM